MRHLPVRRPGALLLVIGLSHFGVVATATAHAELPAPSADDGTTGSGSDVLQPILAAVVVVLVIGGFLDSRRDRSTPSQP